MSSLEQAACTLLDPANLDQDAVSSMLQVVQGRSCDYADFFFQHNSAESFTLEKGVVRGGHYDVHRGFSVRVCQGEKVGFAFSDHIDRKSIQSAVTSAQSIALHKGLGRFQVGVLQPSSVLYAPDNPFSSTKVDEKKALMKSLDAYARSLDSRVKDVIINLSSSYSVVMILALDGLWSADLRPMTRLSMQAIVEDKGQLESASSGLGGRFDYSILLDEKQSFPVADKVVRQAILSLGAEEAVAGEMPVVLGPGWPGMLFHEAVGHGLESDHIRKGLSAFCDSLGEQVASPVCTLIDSGTWPNQRGSLHIDDEGTPAEETVLIENGILKTHLYDRHNAHLMGARSTGNGRRESYAHPPIPRMTNTYLQAGSHDPGEILSSLSRGLYAVDFSGGAVDITSGQFVFSTSEAYFVENGQIVHPVKGATLIGHGPEVLKKISMVGNDLSLDPGIGTCGKDGQSVPVCVGQPTVKIEALTVGGGKK